MDSGVVTVSVLVSGFGPGEGFVKPVDDLPHLLYWKAETVAARGVGESRGLGGEVGIYYPLMSCGRRCACGSPTVGRGREPSGDHHNPSSSDAGVHQEAGSLGGAIRLRDSTSRCRWHETLGRVITGGACAGLPVSEHPIGIEGFPL
jgi:hypothetical protein